MPEIRPILRSPPRPARLLGVWTALLLLVQPAPAAAGPAVMSPVPPSVAAEATTWWATTASPMSPAFPSGSAGSSGDAEPRPAAMRTRLYLGMWSTHLRDLDRGLDSNSLIAIAYRGYFGGTFINSFGDRAVAVGVQRTVSPPRAGTPAASVGYRVGLITGYDERFFGIGDKLPAIPFVQLVGGLDWKNAGVELGYAGIVASAALSWRL